MTTIVFAGGGTGGHLYPALAIARAIKRLDPDIRPIFIGAERGIERDVLPQSEFEYELLDLHPLYRSRPWENWKTLRGATSAWGRIGRHFALDRPAAVVGTGGYVAGLTLGYAWMRHLPIVLQEQNTYPGITTRFFSRFAKQIHLGFPEARLYLSSPTHVRIYGSGNPIEPPPADASDKRRGRAAWGFPADGGVVLLIYGGSQGSRAMNSAVSAWVLRGIPENLFIIWGTGRANYDALASLESDRVKVRAYLSPVSDAYLAADLALSRAGAMATAELCAWGIPMILVPLPSAAADHQTANARALEAAGAAEVIVQPMLSADTLASSVSALINNPAQLRTRAAAALERAKPLAAQEIAKHILELLNLK